MAFAAETGDDNVRGVPVDLQIYDNVNMGVVITKLHSRRAPGVRGLLLPARGGAELQIRRGT